MDSNRTTGGDHKLADTAELLVLSMGLRATAPTILAILKEPTTEEITMIRISELLCCYMDRDISIALAEILVYYRKSYLAYSRFLSEKGQYSRSSFDEALTSFINELIKVNRDVLLKTDIKDEIDYLLFDLISLLSISTIDYLVSYLKITSTSTVFRLFPLMFLGGNTNFTELANAMISASTAYNHMDSLAQKEIGPKIDLMCGIIYNYRLERSFPFIQQPIVKADPAHMPVVEG